MPNKFVSTVCPCGETFQREVKRGRPQVWCKECLYVPFAQRIQSGPVKVIIDGEVSFVSKEAAEAIAAVDINNPVPERISNENDELDSVRAEIEAGMALINVEYKALIQTAIKTYGPFSNEVQAVSARNLTAIQNLYAEWAPRKYKPGREIIEDV